MHKVRVFSLLLFVFALFTITPQIAQAETLPEDQSITDLDPGSETPTPTPDFTATPEVTATPDALPSAGASSTLFMTLVVILLLSSGTYYYSASRRS